MVDGIKLDIREVISSFIIRDQAECDPIKFMRDNKQKDYYHS